MFAYDCNEVHDQIIVESLATLNLDQALVLVGVLNEYRIEYSDRLRAVLRRTKGRTTRSTAPQTPLGLHDAVATVSRLFHIDATRLLAAYERSWRNTRTGPAVEILKERLDRHRFVGKLVPNCSRGDFTVSNACRQAQDGGGAGDSPLTP